MRYKAFSSMLFLLALANATLLKGQETLTWNGGAGELTAADGDGAWNSNSWKLFSPGPPASLTNANQFAQQNVATFIGVNGVAGTINLTGSIVMSNTLTFNQTSVGKYLLTGTGIGSTSSLTINNSNGVTFDNDNTFASVNFGSVLTGSVNGGGSLTAGSFAAQQGTILINLQGAGAFTKTGGVATLSGNNSYSGGTNVNAGTLNANSANALGTGDVSVASLAILSVGASNAIANSATVNISGALNLSAGVSDTVGAVNLTGGTIGGSGTLTGSSYAFQSGIVNANLGSANLNKTTAGGLTLNSSNTYGTVTLTQGAIGGSGSITASSFVVEEGSISNTLSGTAALAKNTASTVTLTGLGNNFSGGTNVNAGVLNANSAGGLGSGNVSVSSGATLNFGANSVINDSASLIVNGTLNVSTFNDTVGSLTLNVGGNINGTGTLTGSSFNLQSGNVTATLAGGNVTVANGATLDSNLTVGSGKTLSGAGTIDGNLVFSAGSFLAVDSTISTTLDLSKIIKVTGGTSTISLTDFTLANLTGVNWALKDAGTYTLISGGAGGVSLLGTSSTIINQFALGGGKFGYFQAGSLDLIITAVPEPSSMMLVILGTAGLAIRRRARR